MRVHRLIAMLQTINQDRGRPLVVSPEVRASLQARYREDIQRLEALISRDLSAWPAQSGSTAGSSSTK